MSPPSRRFLVVVTLALFMLAFGGPATPPASVSAASLSVVRTYFVLAATPNAHQALVPVLRSVSQTPAIAAAAVRALLAGPNSPERSANPAVVTKIPAGVRLLGLSISNGIGTVNLSSRFASGTGHLAMELRLAQLTWTLTQFGSIDGVRLRLDGHSVTSFSGESIPITGPLTRATFRDEVLPPVFVDRPAYRAGFPSGSHATGLANVFEAQFPLTLFDAAGHVLLKRTVTASCGTGCWGRFDVRITYHVGHAQWGRLRVSDVAEPTGKPIEVRDYPVWLTQ